ncbi:MAG: hypothetical protein HYW26_02320 [Candidatus Aenigmarchaeota archaeon]|nr:hypothetical protein [Candidatus Aenigmarchaeota archaeon]
MSVGTHPKLSELLRTPLQDLRPLVQYERRSLSEIEERPDYRFLTEEKIQRMLEQERKRDFRLYETSLYVIDRALRMAPEEVARAFALKPEEIRMVMSLPPGDEEAYQILSSKPLRPPSTNLAYSVNNVWPKWGFAGKPTLTDLAETTRKCENAYEMPYASGYVNAWRMSLNPMGEGNVHQYWEKVIAPDGRLWIVNQGPIRVPDGASALMIYESCVKDSVRGIVQRQRDRIIAGPFFYVGPSVGFSLVGTGDAALKLAGRETVSKRPDENRLGAFLEVTQKAYNACGFEETDYVKRRLDETEALRQGRLTGRLAERDWRPPHGYVHL